MGDAIQLTDLPEELVEVIISHVEDPIDLVSVSAVLFGNYCVTSLPQVSKRFHDFAVKDEFWKQACVNVSMYSYLFLIWHEAGDLATTSY